MEKLNRHELDFALIALPYDTEGFLVKELFDDEFWLVANENDPAFKNKEIQLNNKLTDRLLLLEEGNCLRDHTLKACKRSQLAKHDGIEATSLLTLVQMVESGLGIALLPEMAVKSGLLKQTKLVARALSSSAPKRKIALVARASTARIEEFNALVQVIKA
jgi:LysR family hydrogen peroxide-inducible transcriptional activator